MTEPKATYTVSKDEVDDALEMLGAGYDPAPALPQGFVSPNYTQAPNDFYDYYLKRIDTLAELKVVDTIIRHTFGYHRDRCRLGMQEMAAYTGMSYNSVATGAAAAQARGLIRRLNPETKEKAEWELVVAAPSKFEGSNSEGVHPQSLKGNPSKFEGQVGVKESIKETPRKKKEARATPSRAPAPAEVLIFRSVTGKYPQKVNYPDVVRAVGMMSERLGVVVSADDLRPFYAKWCARNYNPGALTWLVEWAVTGNIPEMQRGAKPAQSDDQRHAANVRRIQRLTGNA